MEDIIDAVFQPALDLLTNAYNNLIQVNLVASRGIAIGRYLGPVAWLGPEWVTLVKSTVMARSLVVTVWAAKAAFGLYLQLKEAVKWW